MTPRSRLTREYLRIPAAKCTWLLFALMIFALPVSAQAPPPARGNAQAMLFGTFADDYGSTHVVSDTLWSHGSRLHYRIVKWNEAGQYLIAQNDAANPSEGSLWTRIDWMSLPGMAPFEWGFCLSAYKAATAAEAEATRVANRATPRTGCNGFPFTRMKRAP